MGVRFLWIGIFLLLSVECLNFAQNQKDMKPGSLVMYIGGQTGYDVERGYGLDPDRVYEVYAVGHRVINGKKLKCLEIVEMPNVSHMMRKFREVQPPGIVDIEELMKAPEKTKEKVGQRQTSKTV